MVRLIIYLVISMAILVNTPATLAHVDGIDLVRTKPIQADLWYRYITGIDDIPYGDCKCASFSVKSAKDWRATYNNEGLYIASSKGAYHNFNAVYVGGSPYLLDSWRFYEPQTGRRIHLGSGHYLFPIYVYTKVILYEYDYGYNPIEGILFSNQENAGTLLRYDMAGSVKDN